MRGGAFALAVAIAIGASPAHADTPPNPWTVARDPAARARWQLHVNVVELFQLAGSVQSEGEGLRQAVLGRARALLEDAGAANSPDVRLRFDLGHIYFALERYALAVDVLEPAVAMSPDAPGEARALDLLAHAYGMVDRPKDERRAYERHLEIETDPQSRAASMLNLSERIMCDGEVDEAIASYEAAYDYAASLPDDPSRIVGQVVWGLAVALDRAGRSHEALAKATYATQLDPGEYLITRDPNVGFSPAYERKWYQALGATAHAVQARGAHEALARWSEVEKDWKAYVDAATPNDRWLSLAKAHLSKASAKRAEAAARAAKEPEPPKGPGADVRL